MHLKEFLVGQLKMHKNRLENVTGSNEFKIKFFEAYAQQGPLGKIQTFDGRTITYLSAVQELKQIQDRIESVQPFSLGFRLSRLVLSEPTLIRSHETCESFFS